MDLLSVADELYALPPGDFTGARNAQVKEAKAEGDKELATRVQQLRKPSLAAWVVNMLMRHNTDEMTQVLELGVSLRKAQADLDGEALRELTRQRRQLIAAMATKARKLAAELGEKVSEAVARQVEDTLHAAMVDESAADAVRSGLLTEPLASTGLGTLNISDAVADGSALGRTVSRAEQPPAPKRPNLAVVPQPEPTEDEQEAAREQARAEAQAVVDKARAAAEKALRKLEKATNQAEKLEARSLQLQARLEELQRQIAEVEHEQEGLDEEIEEAADKQQRAERKQRKAVEELEQAQAELEKLED
jgi:hypothetical protein